MRMNMGTNGDSIPGYLNSQDGINEERKTVEANQVGFQKWKVDIYKESGYRKEKIGSYEITDCKEEDINDALEELVKRIGLR